MTACVNRKHTKKVAAVVTASLVGALSLGVAPVTAMAEDTGIDMQAANWTTGAKVTKATDGKGASLADPNEPIFAQKSGKYLKPSEITNSFGDVTKVDDDYTLRYVQVTSGVESSFSESSFATYTGTGTFGVYVEKTNAAGATEAAGPFYFKISASSQSLESVHAYVGDPASSTIYWTGANLQGDIKFADADGQELEDVKATAWKKADGTPVSTTTDGDGNTIPDITAVGTYVATVSDGTASANVTVVVSPLDLTKVSVSHKDVKASYINPLDSDLMVNGGAYTGSYLKVASVTKSDGSAGFSGSGTYTVTVASAGKVGSVNYDDCVKGSASFTLNVIDTDVFVDDNCKVYYGRDLMNNPETIYLEDGETFDISKVTVSNKWNSGTDSYPNDRLEITFEKGGKAVDASELSNPGTYTMTVRVKPERGFVDPKLVGGSTTCTIKVVPNSASKDENLAFYLDGEIAGNSAEVTYNGSDFLDSIDVVVKVGDKTYAEGTDYTLEIKNAVTGKEVDSIVDAGTYSIKVEPITFKFTGASSDTLNLTVKQVVADQLVADVDSMDREANETTGKIDDSWTVTDADTGTTSTVLNRFYVAYTGSAVEIPGVLYGVQDGTNWTYHELPSDLYNVVSIKDANNKTVEEAVEEGTYTVEIALNDTAGGNYDLGTHETFRFTIKKFGHFTDVDATKWYSVPVEKAADLGYVNGISGTNLFAPEADITRADAVCILFNMAGGKSMPDDDFSFDENTGYNTGFSDVDGHAYFAKALAWARAFGVANGYGDGTFAPYAQITREEFASMLANYAKAMGKFEAADEGALDGMSDANTVSDWAEANVAWAVENGVMGNGGFVAGQSNITRAEVAAMAVNYQPEALEK